MATTTNNARKENAHRYCDRNAIGKNQNGSNRRYERYSVQLQCNPASDIQCIFFLLLFADQTFLDIPFVEPWFDQWREIFLSVQSQSDHEFTRHFLSCLIVLSTSDPNSLETANLLTRKIQMMQNTMPPKIPKWFSTDALNCYVLLHDPSQGDVTLYDKFTRFFHVKLKVEFI